MVKIVVATAVALVAGVAQHAEARSTRVTPQDLVKAGKSATVS
jgi:hypothetical protein